MSIVGTSLLYATSLVHDNDTGNFPRRLKTNLDLTFHDKCLNHFCLWFFFLKTLNNYRLSAKLIDPTMLEFYKVWFFFVNVYSSTVDVENYNFRDSWSLWLLMHDLCFKTIRSKSYKRFSSSPLYVGLYCRFDTDGWWCSWLIIAASRSQSQPKPLQSYLTISVWDNQISDVWFVNHESMTASLDFFGFQIELCISVSDWFVLV